MRKGLFKEECLGAWVRKAGRVVRRWRDSDYRVAAPIRVTGRLGRPVAVAAKPPWDQP